MRNLPNTTTPCFTIDGAKKCPKTPIKLGMVANSSTGNPWPKSQLTNCRHWMTGPAIPLADVPRFENRYGRWLDRFEFMDRIWFIWMEMTHGMTAVGMIRIVLLSWVGDLETTAIIALWMDWEVVVGGEVLKFHNFQLVSYFPACFIFSRLFDVLAIYVVGEL